MMVRHGSKICGPVFWLQHEVSTGYVGSSESSRVSLSAQGRAGEQVLLDSFVGCQRARDMLADNLGLSGWSRCGIADHGDAVVESSRMSIT